MRRFWPLPLLAGCRAMERVAAASERLADAGEKLLASTQRSTDALGDIVEALRPYALYAIMFGGPPLLAWIIHRNVKARRRRRAARTGP